MKKFLIFFVLLFFITAGSFADNFPKPEAITLGHEDKNAFPWVMGGKGGKFSGLDIELMRLMQKECNIKIKFKVMPWNRCLYEMGNGTVDGVFASSYKQDRKKYGAYPVKDGAPDSEKRIHTSGYSLYHLKSRKVGFDGVKFTNIKTLGVQKKYSIIGSLKKFDIQLNDYTLDPVTVLKMLALKRVDAVAIQTERANLIISKHKEMEPITKLDTSKKPFHKKDYFVMLSHDIIKQYPEFAQYFWRNITKVRNSDSFKQKSKEFYEKY